MKKLIKLSLPTLVLTLFTSYSYSQKTDFSDRQAIIETTENFFIGDHTGSIEHKKLSMHKKGAYRYLNRDGAYDEFTFDLNSAEADNTYKEEILSIEIYGRLALVRTRLELVKARLAANNGKVHYKLFTLHKIDGKWKITTITWGAEIKL
ncbi:nuclear transport factor 2 family protein [Ascidiimonas aurantiaca]|uniref:nuclear transport factor 2 family protein n=1 Tax=Ascidiimonas aurantiaca TaxID=1685432 RepID=UPI0030EDCA3C